MKPTLDETSRKYCYVCFKPSVVCICNEIEQVDNKTEILIIQHKCERAHPIGTARIADLGLKNSSLKVAWPDENKKFSLAPESSDGVGLLFPGPNATDLADLSPDKKPEKLILLDGTWGDVKALFRDNPWLSVLPQYSLSPTTPSRYRIRKEPNDTSISTIEAIVQSLFILEPETTGLDSLIAAFDAMIDRQIEYMQANPRDPSRYRFKKPRQKTSRALPPELKEQLNNIVVADGETAPHGSNRRTLIQWVAVRLGDGAMFEQFILPDSETTLTEYHLKLMGLTDDDMKNAISSKKLKELWSSFVKPNDVLVTWNASELCLFEKKIGVDTKSFFLKEAYCNALNRKSGHIGSVVRTHDLPLFPLPVKGRAARQLSEVVAVVKFLNQLDLNTQRRKNTGCQSKENPGGSL